MTNAVIFGAAIITVLNVPALSTHAYFWIPVVVGASLILAAPIAWLIAPRMHWMLNVVTGAVDYPAAVLIRSVEGTKVQQD